MSPIGDLHVTWFFFRGWLCLGLPRSSVLLHWHSTLPEGANPWSINKLNTRQFANKSALLIEMWNKNKSLQQLQIIQEIVLTCANDYCTCTGSLLQWFLEQTVLNTAFGSSCVDMTELLVWDKVLQLIIVHWLFNWAAKLNQQDIMKKPCFCHRWQFLSYAATKSSSNVCIKS